MIAILFDLEGDEYHRYEITKKDWAPAEHGSWPPLLRWGERGDRDFMRSQTYLGDLNHRIYREVEAAVISDTKRSARIGGGDRSP